MSWNDKKPNTGIAHLDSANNFRKWTRLVNNEHVIKILRKIHAHSFLNKYKTMGLKDQEILEMWDALQEGQPKTAFLNMIKVQKEGKDGLIDPSNLEICWYEKGKQYAISMPFHQDEQDFQQQVATFLAVEVRFVEMA